MIPLLEQFIPSSWLCLLFAQKGSHILDTGEVNLSGSPLLPPSADANSQSGEEEFLFQESLRHSHSLPGSCLDVLKPKGVSCSKIDLPVTMLLADGSLIFSGTNE